MFYSKADILCRFATYSSSNTCTLFKYLTPVTFVLHFPDFMIRR